MATEFVGELRALQEIYASSGHRDLAYSVPYIMFHVGMMSGARALNIVPDSAELTFEYRHLAADLGKEILSQIEDAALRASARYLNLCPAARIEVEQFNTYPGLDVAETEGIVAYVQKLAQSNTITKVAFGTEDGFFSELGIPTVVCGPGSMEQQGHKPDESLEIDQLRACDAMIDRILKDISW